MSVHTRRQKKQRNRQRAQQETVQRLNTLVMLFDPILDYWTTKDFLEYIRICGELPQMDNGSFGRLSELIRKDQTEFSSDNVKSRFEEYVQDYYFRKPFSSDIMMLETTTYTFLHFDTNKLLNFVKFIRMSGDVRYQKALTGLYGHFLAFHNRGIKLHIDFGAINEMLRFHTVRKIMDC